MLGWRLKQVNRNSDIVVLTPVAPDHPDLLSEALNRRADAVCDIEGLVGHLVENQDLSRGFAQLYRSDN